MSLQIISKVKRLQSIRAQRIQAQQSRAQANDQDGPVWTPFKGPQSLAYYHPADELFYGGAGGSGKGGLCYSIQWAFDNLKSFTVEDYQGIIDFIPDAVKAMDSKVLMWDGQWKSFSEVQVGDRIMNPDGQMQSVLQIFERGQQEAYRVSFEDGTSVDCDSSHLWGFWKAGKNSRRKTCSGIKPVEDASTPMGWNMNYINRAMVRDTKSMADDVGRGERLIIPIAAPLNYTQLHRGRVDRAYLYGALLGDGSIQTSRFGGSGIRLSSADEWIIERCMTVLDRVFRYDYEGYAADVVIKDKWVDQWARNSGLLGTHSHTKFLPVGYLKESLDFRWALAQGLFDTDGYAARTKNEVSYCTVSPALAEGVANLVRSLGFMAKVRQKQGVAYSKDGAKNGRMAYIVFVEGNNRWKLFSLPRKVEIAQSTESHIWVGKAITNIEPIGRVYSRCIQVSNPNGLYVTDGYNVTHNTDLLLGVAGTAQRRSLILRREFPRARAIIERSREIFARRVSSHAKDSFNESLHLWRLSDGKTIEIGAVQQEKDWVKYQGQAHDLKCFDEITEFTEKQFRSINIWNRSADSSVRVRVIATGNPPTTIEGEWVIDYWAPFLDSEHPEPAEPGSLVWYVRVKTADGDKDLEVGRTSLDEVQSAIESGKVIPRPTYEAPNGKVLTARSRSFVPGRVEDNPVLMARGYDEQLEALPEELRERFRYGMFIRVVESQEFQVIPTDWIVQAQERWKRYMNWTSKEIPKTKDAIALLKQINPNAVQTALGADPSRGGNDDACVAPVYGDWVAPIYTFPAKQILTGRDMALKIAEVREDNALVKIDVIGIGSSPYDACVDAGWETKAMNYAEAAKRANGNPLKDRSGLLTFANLRAYWIWLLMERLDPQHGATLMLPPDPKLKADLASFRRKNMDGGVIRIEGKDDIKKRLGRSPDRGESVIYALSPDPGTLTATPGNVTRAARRVRY